MKLIRFFFSKAFLINLSIALVVTGVGFYFLLNFLDSYTRHGEKIAVPNIVGSNVSDLEELLTSKGFRYEIIDSLEDNNKKPGLIMKQIPKAESFVKDGRKIYITIISSKKETKVYKESVYGKSKEGAVQKLWELLSSEVYNGNEPFSVIQNVLIDSIIYKPSKGDYALEVRRMNDVLLKEGDSLVVGDKIKLVMGSTKIGKKINVPNVVRKTIEEGAQELLASELNYSLTEIGDRSCFGVKDTSNAFIVKQVPSADKEVRIGSEISLFYSCDSTYFKSK